MVVYDHAPAWVRRQAHDMGDAPLEEWWEGLPDFRQRMILREAELKFLEFDLKARAIRAWKPR